MEVIFERVAALDVHKAQVTACVRVPREGPREQHLAEFATTVRGLLTLRDWLEAHQVSHVVMEATGVYWKPVWAVLEDSFECLLVNARHVKQILGRRHLERVVAAYTLHYNEHRPLRSLDQRSPLALTAAAEEPVPGEVPRLDWLRRRDRLGGLTHEYQLAA